MDGLLLLEKNKLAQHMIKKKKKTRFLLCFET